jgi:hypothetical protein
MWTFGVRASVKWVFSAWLCVGWSVEESVRRTGQVDLLEATSPTGFTELHHWL